MQFVLQYVYDYDNVVLEDTDFQKRKRVKNTVPYFERCKALRANGEQQSDVRNVPMMVQKSFAVHMKGTPHVLFLVLVVKQILLKGNNINKI